MKVTRGFSTNPGQSLTDPFPKGNGVYFALHGGDVLDPVGIGTNWFQPPYPKHVLHYFVKLNMLPFLSWRFGSQQGYIGWKCYGVDAPAYKDWLCDPVEVYDGSLALCLTVRNGLTAAVPAALATLLWWLL